MKLINAETITGVMLLLSVIAAESIIANDEEGTSHEEIEEASHEEMTNVVLFPWLSMLIGVVAYYLLSRYLHALPYTAVMFMSGAILGYAALHFNSHNNAIVDSTRLWLGINGELIILAFLPGLLFLDSYNINSYKFKRSFSQILTFAFPMVLGGTALTALVAYYIFPYGWSFDLSMTFGSILSATDPVAVAVLLNGLGAPSRLKVHVSGESLMNDGSGVVFFQIFSSRFFHSLGFHGFEQVGWARGFALFFRLSLGGACIGLLFGIGLVAILFNLNRRLSKEENVIQVTSTIMTAYLSFYVSEILAGCSGIIAVVFCGLTTKAFGEALINDSHLTEDFWHIMEHLLNTTLFTLGGAVWGGIIDFGSSEDWMYLLILYVSVNIIRCILVLVLFPITSNLGIGQSWREAIFMSWGGLRGAVGIALALLISAETINYSAAANVPLEQMQQYQQYVDKLFGMVGGTAFLTLVINAPTCAPLLKYLGLVTPTEARKQVVKNYEQHMRQNTLVEFMRLLADSAFAGVDYQIVREKVSPLANVTPTELEAAIYAFRRRYPDKVPNLDNMMSYVGRVSSESLSAHQDVEVNSLSRSTRSLRASAAAAASSGLKRGKASHAVNKASTLELNTLIRLSTTFQYHRQLHIGELDSRGGTPFSLLQSLQLAMESVMKGKPLDDWAGVKSQMLQLLFFNFSLLMPALILPQVESLGKLTRKCDKLLHKYRVGGMFSREGGDEDFHVIRTHVLQALSFIKAHLSAQETFCTEFANIDGNSLSLSEKAVLDESKEQVARAEAVIAAFDAADVNAIKSQYCCQILLYKCADYFCNLSMNGLMSEREAGEFLEQYDRELRQLRNSSEMKYEIVDLKMSKTRTVPRNVGRR
ncbi:hypothetical protein ACHAXN_009383 [Cyclotella atomus]